MTILVDPERTGARWPLTIDGYQLAIRPRALSVPLPAIEDKVDTLDGGSQTFQLWPGEGHADRLNRLSLQLAFEDFGRFGDVMYQLQRLVAKGGYRSFTLWKPSTVWYTARAGQTRFYLPRYRRNAAQVYASLVILGTGIAVTTVTVPARVWVNDVELTANYVATPDDLPIPATAGNFYLSATAETDGAQQDNTPFVLPACALGDTVELLCVFEHSVTLDEQEDSYPETVSEGLSIRISER